MNYPPDSELRERVVSLVVIGSLTLWVLSVPVILFKFGPNARLLHLLCAVAWPAWVILSMCMVIWMAYPLWRVPAVWNLPRYVIATNGKSSFLVCKKKWYVAWGDNYTAPFGYAPMALEHTYEDAESFLTDLLRKEGRRTNIWKIVEPVDRRCFRAEKRFW